MIKEIFNFQSIIEKDDLNSKSKHGKTCNFGKYLLAIVFSRNINEWYLLLEDVDNKQSNFCTEFW